MPITRRLALAAPIAALALSIAACTQEPGTAPAQGVTYLPFAPITTEPVRTAINATTAYYADAPGRLGGRPALAAQVAAQYEFAADQIKELRYHYVNPLAPILMGQGRDELRAALGVAPAAPPMAVVESLTAAAGALSRGDQGAAERALSGPNFTRPPAEVMATLAAMPPVPVAGRAAGFTQGELDRPDSMRIRTN